jgi:hypothetical protein
MLKRPKVDAEDRREFSTRLDKLTARIYLFFAIGLFMRAAQVRPEKISISGIELTISNTNVLPGVFYILCLASYISLFSYIVVGTLQTYIHSNTRMYRHLIYICTGRKGTLIGRSPVYIRAIKSLARKLLKIYIWLSGIYMLIPLLCVLIFEMGAVLSVILALFA